MTKKSTSKQRCSNKQCSSQNPIGVKTWPKKARNGSAQIEICLNCRRFLDDGRTSQSVRANALSTKSFSTSRQSIDSGENSAKKKSKREKASSKSSASSATISKTAEQMPTATVAGTVNDLENHSHEQHSHCCKNHDVAGAKNSEAAAAAEQASATASAASSTNPSDSCAHDTSTCSCRDHSEEQHHGNGAKSVATVAENLSYISSVSVRGYCLCGNMLLPSRKGVAQHQCYDCFKRTKPLQEQDILNARKIAEAAWKQELLQTGADATAVEKSKKNFDRAQQMILDSRFQFTSDTFQPSSTMRVVPASDDKFCAVCLHVHLVRSHPRPLHVIRDGKIMRDGFPIPMVLPWLVDWLTSEHRICQPHLSKAEVLAREMNAKILTHEIQNEFMLIMQAFEELARQQKAIVVPPAPVVDSGQSQPAKRDSHRITGAFPNVDDLEEGFVRNLHSVSRALDDIAFNINKIAAQNELVAHENDSVSSRPAVSVAVGYLLNQLSHEESYLWTAKSTINPLYYTSHRILDGLMEMISHLISRLKSNACIQSCDCCLCSGRCAQCQGSLPQGANSSTITDQSVLHSNSIDFFRSTMDITQHVTAQRGQCKSISFFGERLFMVSMPERIAADRGRHRPLTPHPSGKLVSRLSKAHEILSYCAISCQHLREKRSAMLEKYGKKDSFTKTAKARRPLFEQNYADEYSKFNIEADATFEQLAMVAIELLSVSLLFDPIDKERHPESCKYLHDLQYWCQHIRIELSKLIPLTEPWNDSSTATLVSCECCLCRPACSSCAAVLHNVSDVSITQSFSKVVIDLISKQSSCQCADKLCQAKSAAEQRTSSNTDEQQSICCDHNHGDCDCMHDEDVESPSVGSQPMQTRAKKQQTNACALGTCDCEVNCTCDTKHLCSCNGSKLDKRHQQFLNKHRIGNCFFHEGALLLVRLSYNVWVSLQCALHGGLYTRSDKCRECQSAGAILNKRIRKFERGLSSSDLKNMEMSNLQLLGHSETVLQLAEQKLSKSKQELDALRKQLAQEHDDQARWKLFESIKEDQQQLILLDHFLAALQQHDVWQNNFFLYNHTLFFLKNVAKRSANGRRYPDFIYRYYLCVRWYGGDSVLNLLRGKQEQGEGKQAGGSANVGFNFLIPSDSNLSKHTPEGSQGISDPNIFGKIKNGFHTTYGNEKIVVGLAWDEMEIIPSWHWDTRRLMGFGTHADINESNIVDFVSEHPNPLVLSNKVVSFFMILGDGSSFPIGHWCVPTAEASKLNKFKSDSVSFTAEKACEIVEKACAEDISVEWGVSDGGAGNNSIANKIKQKVPGYLHIFDSVHLVKTMRNYLLDGHLLRPKDSIINMSVLTDARLLSPEIDLLLNDNHIKPKDKMDIKPVVDLFRRTVNERKLSVLLHSLHDALSQDGLPDFYHKKRFLDLADYLDQVENLYTAFNDKDMAIDERLKRLAALSKYVSEWKPSRTRKHKLEAATVHHLKTTVDNFPKILEKYSGNMEKRVCVTAFGTNVVEQYFSIMRRKHKKPTAFHFMTNSVMCWFVTQCRYADEDDRGFSWRTNDVTGKAYGQSHLQMSSPIPTAKRTKPSSNQSAQTEANGWALQIKNIFAHGLSISTQTAREQHLVLNRVMAERAQCVFQECECCKGTTQEYVNLKCLLTHIEKHGYPKQLTIKCYNLSRAIAQRVQRAGQQVHAAESILFDSSGDVTLVDDTFQQQHLFESAFSFEVEEIMVSPAQFTAFQEVKMQLQSRTSSARAQVSQEDLKEDDFDGDPFEEEMNLLGQMRPDDEETPEESNPDETYWFVPGGAPLNHQPVESNSGHAAGQKVVAYKRLVYGIIRDKIVPAKELLCADQNIEAIACRMLQDVIDVDIFSANRLISDIIEELEATQDKFDKDVKEYLNLDGTQRQVLAAELTATVEQEKNKPQMCMFCAKKATSQNCVYGLCKEHCILVGGFCSHHQGGSKIPVHSVNLDAAVSETAANVAPIRIDEVLSKLQGSVPSTIRENSVRIVILDFEGTNIMARFSAFTQMSVYVLADGGKGDASAGKKPWTITVKPKDHKRYEKLIKDLFKENKSQVSWESIESEGIEEVAALKQLLQMLYNPFGLTIVVSHNLYRYDWPMLVERCREVIGKDWQSHCGVIVGVDSVQMLRSLDTAAATQEVFANLNPDKSPNQYSYSMSVLSKALLGSSSFEGQHNAEADVQQLLRLLCHSAAFQSEQRLKDELILRGLAILYLRKRQHHVLRPLQGSAGAIVLRPPFVELGAEQQHVLQNQTSLSAQDTELLDIDMDIAPLAQSAHVDSTPMLRQQSEPSAAESNASTRGRPKRQTRPPEKYLDVQRMQQEQEALEREAKRTRTKR